MARSACSTDVSFGTNLKAARKLKKRKQEYVAQALDVKQATVSAWESDHSVPGGNRLMQLATLLDVPVEELTKGDPRFEVAYVAQPPIEKRDARSILTDLLMSRGGEVMTPEARERAVDTLMEMLEFQVAKNKKDAP